MLEEATSTHVKVMTLRPVVHVVEWVEVAHSNLDGAREHTLILYELLDLNGVLCGHANQITALYKVLDLYLKPLATIF